MQHRFPPPSYLLCGAQNRRGSPRWCGRIEAPKARRHPSLGHLPQVRVRCGLRTGSPPHRHSSVSEQFPTRTLDHWPRRYGVSVPKQPFRAQTRVWLHWLKGQPGVWCGSFAVKGATWAIRLPKSGLSAFGQPVAGRPGKSRSFRVPRSTFRVRQGLPHSAIHNPHLCGPSLSSVLFWSRGHFPSPSIRPCQRRSPSPVSPS